MGKDSISSERTGLFWTLLDTKKLISARRCIASDFNCHALHPDSKTTVLAQTIGKGLSATTAEQKQCLELIKALRVAGASWTQPCKSDEIQSIWIGDQDSSSMTVDIGTHSALSYAQAWLRQLHEKEGWESEVWYLNEVVEIYLAEPQRSRSKLPIDEDIVSKFRKKKLFVCVFFSRFPCESRINSIPQHWVCQSFPLSHLANLSLLIWLRLKM